ncbi:MAG: hypothetical protein EOO24_16540, partial [Comamonadaceae bacterium]
MPPPRKYPDSRLPWFVLAFALLTGALLALALWVLRAEALRSGEERAAALSQVISEQTSRTLQSVDARLQLAALQLETAAAGGRLDESTARELLRAQLSELPFVRAIWVVDAAGRVVFASAVGQVGTLLDER